MSEHGGRKIRCNEQGQSSFSTCGTLKYGGDVSDKWGSDDPLRSTEVAWKSDRWREMDTEDGLTEKISD